MRFRACGRGLLSALVLLATAASSARAQQGKSPAPWNGVAPPARIEGIPELRPVAPLEFSRAWLARMEEVRVRREELFASGELDGLDLDAAVARGAALAGTLRVPVIPLLYAGARAPFPESMLEKRLFGASRGDTLSYADYWSEVSSGLLRVEGQVAPWTHLPKPARHYLPRAEFGWGRFGRIDEARREAIMAADAHLDFRLFDNDGPDGIPDSGDDDGYADFVALVYALPCPGDGREGGIWPHRAAMAPIETADTSRATGQPIRVSDYVILPAVDPEHCGPLHIGVLAHETGHALGLPDLYDYDGSSQGIGAWGLMGTGSHMAKHSPAHLDAWSKEQLGWVRVQWIGDTTELAIPPVQRDPLVYRFDLGESSDRYLLLENRQRLGSDRYLPGHGLLIWEIDPERGELGAWNRDERRGAVRLLQADGREDLVRGYRGDSGDPFPGAQRRRSFVSRLGSGLELSGIAERGGVIQARAVPAGGAVAVRPERSVVRMTALAGSEGAQLALGVARSAEIRWDTRAVAPWLEAQASGDVVQIHARPGALDPGVYLDTLHITDSRGQALAHVLVSFHVAAPSLGQIVATELPWSWGLTAHKGRLLHASYGWDPLGLRPRPRVLELREGHTHPRTLARLPADALYAPVIDRDDESVYVIARARGENYVYRIVADGEAELVGAGIGTDPLYGAAFLPDGSLLVAEWSGTLHRIDRDGRVDVHAKLNASIYQLGADAEGNVFMASLGGDVLRLGTAGDVVVLRTGFEPGRLVALTVTPGGDVYAGERGGEGRVVRLGADGSREVVYRSPGAQYYGLAIDHAFLYALDLGTRTLLRIPLPPLPSLPAVLATR